MNRKLLGVSIIIIILFSGFAFAGSGDEIKVGLIVDPENVNYLKGEGQNSRDVFAAMYQGLLGEVDMKNMGKRKLLLAESVEVMPNKKDIKVIMRKDPKFHNGDPVTAHDVKFTIDQLLDPANMKAAADILEDNLEELEIVDDYTLIYRFYEPYAPWEDIIGLPVVSKKYFEKAGEDKFGKHPVGSGAFRFVERKIGEYVLLEAVENHHDYKPAFKRLKFVTATDPVSRIAMLERGELDLITEITPHQLRGLKRNKNITIKRTDQIPSMFLMPCRVSWFPELKNPKIRQAMSHAINRQEIVDKLFLGEGYPLYVWTTRSGLDFFPDFKTEFDPVKAKKLLKESGYKPGTELTLTYTSATPNGSLLGQVIQKYLTDVGLSVSLNQLERGVYVTYLRAKDKRTGHMSLSGRPWPQDPSSRFFLLLASDGPYCSYNDRPNQKELDDLIAAQAKETDAEKREAIFRKIHEIDFNDPFYIPLFGLNMIYAMNKRIDYTWVDGALFLIKLDEIKMN